MLLFDSIYSFPTVILGLTVLTLLGAERRDPHVRGRRRPDAGLCAPHPHRDAVDQELRISSRRSASLGASPLRIIAVHILPNIVGPLLIIASMDIPSVVALEAGLTYLGMGIPPPAPSWGRILQEGYNLIREAPWIVVAGGIPLIITTLGFTFLGESLRDMLDPRLRRIV